MMGEFKFEIPDDFFHDFVCPMFTAFPGVLAPICLSVVHSCGGSSGSNERFCMI